MLLHKLIYKILLIEVYNAKSYPEADSG